jgi:hypothetical protein
LETWYLPLTLPKTTSPELDSKPNLALGKKKTSWLKRPLTWALALFALANIGLGEVSRIDQNRSARNGGGDFWTNPALIDLAVAEFKGQNPPAQVVLLGSSLVMFPFWAMDASFDRNIPNIAQYHKSVALEASLKKFGLNSVPVFSLASAGQMSSDTYLYVSELLKGPRKPKVIVWGIAPRDFGDENVRSPMATVSFKQIVGLENLASYAPTFLPRFEDRIEFVANKICYLYGKRWRFQKEVEKSLGRLGEYLLKSPGAAVSVVAASATPAVSSATPVSDMRTLLSGTYEQRWNASIREYRSRYRGIAERDLSVQMSCLDRTLKLCKERGIKVVLVNMPLTQTNEKLMPEGFYNRFVGDVQREAAAYGEGVTFLDLSKDRQFKDSDYWDTVHMNHTGGAKLVNDIIFSVQRYLRQ